MLTARAYFVNLSPEKSPKMVEYTPFTKILRDVEAIDLVALRQAVEGWYVEYKREVPNATSIAKSLSSFANTYGG